MSQINFQADAVDGLRFVQTGWDRVNQRFHLTVWDGKGLDEDSPLWSCEDSPITSSMDCIDALCEAPILVLLEGPSMMRVRGLLEDHKRQNLGNVIENLGLLP